MPQLCTVLDSVSCNSYQTEESTPVLQNPPGKLNVFKSFSKLPHKFSLFSGSPFSTIPAEINSGGYPNGSKMLNLKY